jgi:hypothetical protein
MKQPKKPISDLQVQEQMRQLEKQIIALVAESNARKEKRAQQALAAAAGPGASGLAMHNTGKIKTNLRVNLAKPQKICSDVIATSFI